MDSNPDNTTGTDHKVKLSGAARKRLKFLISQNIQFEEALKLCHLPFKSLKDKFLDVRSPKQSSTKSSMQEVKQSSTKSSMQEVKQSSTKSSMQEVHQPSAEERRDDISETSLKLGIKNKKPMSDQELHLVRQALLASILEISDKQLEPKFGGCSHKAGWLLTICEDIETKHWLEQQISSLKPWPDAELSFIQESEFPKPTIGEVFIPSSETDESSVAIALIKTQNVGLSTEHWEILKQEDNDAGITLIVSLDDHSAEVIRSMDCKVQVGFTKVHFKLFGSADKDPSKHQNDEGSSTSRHRPDNPQLAKTTHGCLVRGRGVERPVKSCISLGGKLMRVASRTEASASGLD